MSDEDLAIDIAELLVETRDLLEPVTVELVLDTMPEDAELLGLVPPVIE